LGFILFCFGLVFFLSNLRRVCGLGIKILIKLHVENNKIPTQMIPSDKTAFQTGLQTHVSIK